MIFCQIDNELVDIIKKYAGKRAIVDVGCGIGLLGSMLKEVISIDLQMKPDPLIPNIMYMDAEDFPFSKPFFPIFIRPCHGHFVSRIMYTHRNNVENFLYISMPHNLEIDVDLDMFNAEVVEDWIGKDGERVHLITLKGDSLNG